MRKTTGLWGAGIVLALASAGGATWWDTQGKPAAPKGAVPIRVCITKGMSVQKVGNTLQWKGIVKSSFYFTQIAHGSKIRPGIYELDPSETPSQLLKHLAIGETNTTRVTIPEGFTLRQIAARLKEKGVLSAPDETVFLTLCTEQGKTLQADFPLSSNLEGYLFPDTYNFEPGRTPKQVAQTMLDNFSQRIAGKVPAGTSLDRVLNIAAMVEREAETQKDRPLIAGVIENRLQKNMRLEIDATVQYARGVHKSRLMFSDLKIESAYNTYKVKGLPPTPICSPGLPSIEAALAPATHDYLFYVAGKDGKAHIFAKTFEEHKANIAHIRHS
jgi:UPF0755 protein